MKRFGVGILLLCLVLLPYNYVSAEEKSETDVLVEIGLVRGNGNGLDLLLSGKLYDVIYPYSSQNK